MSASRLASTLLAGAGAQSCMLGARVSTSTQLLARRAALPARSQVSSLRIHAQPALPTARCLSSSSRSPAPESKGSSPSATISEWLDERLDQQFQERRTHGGLATGTTVSGRSIQVHNGDVQRAYRNMNAVLQKDQIRAELRRGERYEKPNQERRRKRSERHRRRFADLVRKKVQLVMALRMRDA